ncbi:DUF4435 domain-containing protein [Myxococcota bacterium]|nr:DUF4435 domain-containing protein [Myxococcota bacterium]
MTGGAPPSPTEARQDAAIRTGLGLERHTLGKDVAILLVEGPTDAHFWRQVGHKKVYPKPCNGREAVLKELRAVHAGGPIPGLLAVIDVDWDHIDGTPHGLPDLFTTDTRDLESMLVLCERSLDAVVRSYADPDAHEAMEASQGAELRALLLERARLFGRLRWLHRRRGCTFAFHDGLLNTYVDANTWLVDEAGLLQALVTMGLAPDEVTLRAELVTLPEVQDAWLCRGHDLLILLARALSGPLKPAGQRKQPGQDDLLRALTLAAVPSGALNGTRLFVELRAWGVQNPSYAFL